MGIEPSTVFCILHSTKLIFRLFSSIFFSSFTSMSAPTPSNPTPTSVGAKRKHHVMEDSEFKTDVPTPPHAKSLKTDPSLARVYECDGDLSSCVYSGDECDDQEPEEPKGFQASRR